MGRKKPAKLRALPSEAKPAPEVNPITYWQYRDMITALNLSQLDAAKFLDVAPRTSRNWALGQKPIPLAVGMLLALMVKKNITPDIAYDIRRMYDYSKRLSKNA
jgi:hypothetical protein